MQYSLVWKATIAIFKTEACSAMQSTTKRLWRLRTENRPLYIEIMRSSFGDLQDGSFSNMLKMEAKL